LSSRDCSQSGSLGLGPFGPDRFGPDRLGPDPFRPGPFGPSRRDFLKACAAAALIAAPLGLSGCSHRSRWHALLDEWFGVDWPELDRLAKVYLERFPAESDIQHLRSALHFEIQDEGEVRALLVADRDQDFRSGDFVLLDGWEIARTEARVMAMERLESGPVRR